ncbi:MAG: polysaccharide biosynthesis/export family protein [Pseudomonadota bacterium]
MSACATDRTFGTASDIEVTDLTTLPEPEGQLSYVIGPREKIEITVLGGEEISGVFLTDEAGDLAFPFLGKVATGGRSANEAADLIASGLRGRFLRDPQVRVVPEELVSPSVSVGGQVTKPGSYPVFDNASLLKAVNLAEGLADTADTEDVLIIREVGGQRYIGLYNLKAIQRGNYEDPELFAGDIIMVGESAARRRLATILSFVPLASTAAIIIDRLGR